MRVHVLFPKFNNVLSPSADLLFPMELIKVLTALEPVVGDWYMLGLHLGLSSSVVDTIERDYHTTPERKKRMVQRWMSTPQLCPSWCSLVKALRKVGLNTAAERISKEHSKCSVIFSYSIQMYFLCSKAIFMATGSDSTMQLLRQKKSRNCPNALQRTWCYELLVKVLRNS